MWSLERFYSIFPKRQATMTLKSELETLQQRVDTISRTQQSDKDKAIAKTNQRIDALKREVEELREMVAELLRSEL